MGRLSKPYKKVDKRILSLCVNKNKVCKWVNICTASVTCICYLSSIYNTDAKCKTLTLKKESYQL